MPVNRIVKMIFREQETARFRELFERKKETIRHFPGCLHLELWQDSKDPRLFFTFSTWESETHLENYRQSPFFAATWQQTKALFAEKAAAWTVKIQ